MIAFEVDHELPTGVTLRVREHGPADGPVLVMLHGFPEGAFAWDPLAERLAGAGYRCVAPYLRGFGPSSHPGAVEDYRISEVATDIATLIMQVSPGRPVEALIAHDWGGAAAWGLAAKAPQLMGGLVIVNSPHPAAFLRDLRDSPEQRAASEYMDALAAPDAERRFAEDGYRRLWRFFEGMGAAERGWLTDDERERYTLLWDEGLTGGLNYYRATPARPGLPLDDVRLPSAVRHIDVRTLVIWGLGDTALLPGLLDGLDDWVPDLRVERVADATHWVVHEQPELVEQLVRDFLSG